MVSQLLSASAGADYRKKNYLKICSISIPDVDEGDEEESGIHGLQPAPRPHQVCHARHQHVTQTPRHQVQAPHMVTLAGSADFYGCKKCGTCILKFSQESSKALSVNCNPLEEFQVSRRIHTSCISGRNQSATTGQRRFTSTQGCMTSFGVTTKDKHLADRAHWVFLYQILTPNCTTLYHPH